MLASTIPEILRTSLTEICLQTKLMINEKIKIEDFLKKCISSPSIASIRQSIKFLQCLGALDLNEDLTVLGSHLAHMPVDAKYGKMLVYGAAFNCLDPVLSIVAILSMGDQIFVLPTRPADRFKSNQVRRNLGESSSSDHFVLLRIFQQWSQLRKMGMNDRKFCDDNFISSVAMDRVRGIRQQILSYLQNSGLTRTDLGFLNQNSSKWPVVKACLCAGLYPNVARIDRKKKSMYSDIDRKLSFHMSSIMSSKNDRSLDFVKGLPADWVVYEEKNLVGRTPMIKCNTLINSFSLSLSAGASFKTEFAEQFDADDEDESQLIFKIDELVTFVAENDRGSLILDLRHRLDELITRFLSVKNFSFEVEDQKLISTAVRVIEIEEKRSGFESIALAERTVDRGNTRRDDRYKPPNQRPSTSYPKTNEKFSNNQRQNPRPKLEMNFQQPAGVASRGPQPNSQQSSTPLHKFFIMKMENVEKINSWAAKIVFDISELGLNDWLLSRLTNKVRTGEAFMRIFFSHFHFSRRTVRKFSSHSTRPLCRSFSASVTSCRGSTTSSSRSVWPRTCPKRRQSPTLCCPT